MIRHLLLISVADLILCLLSGAIGWQNQMIIASASTLLTIFIAYKISHRRLVALLCAIPFVLFYTILSLSVANRLNYPVWILSTITFLLAIFSVRYLVSRPFGFTFFLLFFLLAYFLFYPNYFVYETTKSNLAQYDPARAVILDGKGEPIGPDFYKNKIVLYDIWHSACLPCIQQFPEVQKLKDYFRNDSSVRIVTLNIPLERDNQALIQSLTHKYTFDKFSFKDTSEYHKLSIELVPLVLIMDKNGKCKYAGQLRTEWNIFVGNAKRIIKHLRNEI
jgi:hypothetical protein